MPAWIYLDDNNKTHSAMLPNYLNMRFFMFTLHFVYFVCHKHLSVYLKKKKKSSPVNDHVDFCIFELDVIMLIQCQDPNKHTGPFSLRLM